MRASCHSIDALAQHLGLGSLGFNSAANDEHQHEQSVEHELDAYMASEREASGTDLLMYWHVSFILLHELFNINISTKLKHHQYPIIFRIAMDYFAIQATSVPCEHVFSSSAKTNTK